MIKIKQLLSLHSFQTNGFITATIIVRDQFHADEKRNVKQPPLLTVINNLSTSFYNEKVFKPRMS